LSRVIREDDGRLVTGVCCPLSTGVEITSNRRRYFSSGSGSKWARNGVGLFVVRETIGLFGGLVLGPMLHNELRSSDPASLVELFNESPFPVLDGSGLMGLGTNGVALGLQQLLSVKQIIIENNHIP
jgi:hypothetical protein